MPLSSQNPTDPPRPRPDLAEMPWPPRWARTTAFFFGLGLIGFEAVIAKPASLWVVGVGLILTGLPLAHGADRLVDLLQGRSR